MIYQLITMIAVVFAGLWAAIRLTVVGFGVASATLAAGLVLWSLLVGIDAEVLIVGFGVWLLFNASFFLGGIGLSAFGGRLGLLRSRSLPIKEAKSH
jgi:hypothetical protein